ncbi:hypothetical protein HYV50_04470 [Candidatus Pacearchaeota archaeon]|nr:hypothetical protein [Candidatus Pacearchaeota archaeon]
MYKRGRNGKVRKDYFVDFYFKLIDRKDSQGNDITGLRKRLGQLDMSDNVQFDEKRAILLELGIGEILVGNKYFSINSKKYDARCLRFALERIKVQVDKYFERYRENFERDVRNGVLDRLCNGEQLGLDFRGRIRCGELPLCQGSSGRLGRNEARFYYILNRRK